MVTAHSGKPFTDDEKAAIVDEFKRDGTVVLKGALEPDHARLLRERTEDYFQRRDEIAQRHVSYVGTTFVLRRCAELDQVYADMISHEPVYGLASAVFGDEARFNAMNVIRNEPGQAISNWHVDDTIEFPLPESVARFDARIRMPVFWFTAQIALSDIEADEYGPTQYVPTSHYSGRRPPGGDKVDFEGHGPTSIYCRTGDVYFTNHQTWHRGAPNVSDRIRYVMQVQYATRWADARFRGVA